MCQPSRDLGLSDKTPTQIHGQTPTSVKQVGGKPYEAGLSDKTPTRVHGQTPTSVREPGGPKPYERGLVDKTPTGAHKQPSAAQARSRITASMTFAEFITFSSCVGVPCAHSVGEFANDVCGLFQVNGPALHSKKVDHEVYHLHYCRSRYHTTMSCGLNGWSRWCQAV